MDPMVKIDVNGAELNYSEKGTGDPLVLVHGSASDYRAWQSQHDEFANHFRTINYSRRYHYPNTEIPEGMEYLMDEHVEDLRALIKSLGVAPAHVVGHSYGGFLSLLMAIREPSLVRSLVLIEPPAITLFVSSNPKPGELLKLLLTRPRTALAIIKFGATGVEPSKKAFRNNDMEAGVRIFADAVLGKNATKTASSVRRQQAEANLGNIKAEILGPGMLKLDPADVSRLEVPTLLIQGEKSIPMFHRILDRLEELLPNVRRETIRGARHNVQEDNPAEFNEVALRFLEKMD